MARVAFRPLFPSRCSTDVPQAYLCCEDFNLITAVQVLWYRSDKVTPAIKTLWAGRLLSALILCYAGWSSRLKDGAHVEDGRKTETLAAFMLLSCCLAPISWLYMYVLGTPAVVILGKRVWQGSSGFIETVSLLWFIVSLSINPFVGLAVRAGLPMLHYHVIAVPLLGVALGIMMLRKAGNKAKPLPSTASCQFIVLNSQFTRSRFSIRNCWSTPHGA